MPQSGLSKPSKIDLLAPSAPQIASSLFICGTNLLPKCKIASTSSGARALHRTTRRMKRLKAPYNFNRYPLAPLGTRAIIYKDSDTRASGAPHGLGAWCLGRSKTSTVAINIASLKTGGIEYPDPLTCSHNTSKNCHAHISATSGNYHWNSKKTCLPSEENLHLSKSSNFLHDTYLQNPPPCTRTTGRRSRTKGDCQHRPRSRTRDSKGE
jgi:hypothetical protein